METEDKANKSSFLTDAMINFDDGVRFSGSFDSVNEDGSENRLKTAIQFLSQLCFVDIRFLTVFLDLYSVHVSCHGDSTLKTITEKKSSATLEVAETEVGATSTAATTTLEIAESAEVTDTLGMSIYLTSCPYLLIYL